MEPEPGDWLAVREYLRRNRHELTARAARLYPADAAVAGTPLLSAPGWLLDAPLPVRDITIEFRPDAAPAPELGPPVSYAETMLALAPPAVFENRPTYRLLDADLPRLVFGPGCYFDGIDTGEAVAHEYAAGGARLRDAIGNPLDLTRRPANLAISTLTVRRDRAGRARFLLHWRDPAKVAHAGGMYQVVPVGMFQPPGSGDADPRGADHPHPPDELWRSMVREFAEELAGQPEGADIEPFVRRMTDALNDGRIGAWCVGLGVDPLSFATDLLTVLVIDEDLFGELCRDAGRLNAEGRVLTARTFDASTVTRTVQDEPLQAAGAAVLRLAWTHRAAFGLG
ncbi:MAG TPA: hypothetical protein VGG16_25050 [Streptosporangiaceae bacterium]|jgi:hypothetical protein